MQALSGAGVLVGYGFAAATQDGRRRLRKAVPEMLRQPVVTPATLMQSVRTVAGYRIEKLAEQRPEWFNTDLSHLMTMLADGGIAPIVERTYRLDEAASAHRHLASASFVGKLVLRME